jgi:hypothetical protein
VKTKWRHTLDVHPAIIGLAQTPEIPSDDIIDRPAMPLDRHLAKIEGGDHGSDSEARARLVRAVRALVRDGLAPEAVIAARRHQRTAAAQDRQAVVHAIAAVVGENRGATLQEVAARLAALRLYPPRGGTLWSTSSVPRIVRATKRDGLLPAQA